MLSISAAAITLATLFTASPTSTLFTLAYCNAASVASSKAGPVSPNFVFKFAIEVPTSPSEDGTLPATFSNDSISPSAASPVAPVPAMIPSVASSTSFQATIAAPPTARMGPVTLLVNPVPTLSILSPAALNPSPTFFRPSDIVSSLLIVGSSASSVLLSRSLYIFNLDSVSSTSRLSFR